MGCEACQLHVQRVLEGASERRSAVVREVETLVAMAPWYRSLVQLDMRKPWPAVGPPPVEVGGCSKLAELLWEERRRG